METTSADTLTIIAKKNSGVFTAGSKSSCISASLQASMESALLGREALEADKGVMTGIVRQAYSFGAHAYMFTMQGAGASLFRMT
jgi:hypothetical protein